MASFTGHIDDSATGLTYMQARYYDPNLGRFLSMDPVGFTPDMPFMFNSYAYVGNDPIGAIDPSGETAYLIARPLSFWDSANHMFVAVVDEKTSAIRQFSYGPQKGAFSPGKLVGMVDYESGTGGTDRAALTQFLADPQAAQEKGIFAAVINATDEAVIASGEQMNALLGTKANPGENAPGYDKVPHGGHSGYSSTQGYTAPQPGTANSNSASYGVADRSNPNTTQAAPAGYNPGIKQHSIIPRYAILGSRIKKEH